MSQKVEARQGKGCDHQPHALIWRGGRSGCQCLGSYEASGRWLGSDDFLVHYLGIKIVRVFMVYENQGTPKYLLEML